MVPIDIRRSPAVLGGLMDVDAEVCAHHEKPARLDDSRR
jgi:hypothetical protein